MKGKIYPEEAMILRIFVGEGGANGKSYEVLTTMSQEPIVQSKQTGKYYHLTWSDIINMAVEAGIDEEETAVGITCS